MRSPRITTVERHELADGFVALEKMGRGYFVTRGYREPGVPPDTWPEPKEGLASKRKAYDKLAAILEADVTEQEE